MLIASVEEQLRSCPHGEHHLERAQHMAGLGLGGLKTMGPAKIMVGAARVKLIFFAAS